MSRIGNYEDALSRKQMQEAGIYVPDPEKSHEEKQVDFHNYCMRALIASAQFELTPEEAQKAIETLKK